MRNLDRGGLLCPHPDIVLAISINYIIIKKLLSKEYEDKFLKTQCQRSTAMKLTFQILLDKEYLNFDTCSEGHSLELILQHILKSSTNTFLKNYCAQRNDVKNINRAQKRKLQTLKN